MQTVSFYVFFLVLEISFCLRENKSVFVVDFNQARQLNNFQFSKSSNDSRLRKQRVNIDYTSRQCYSELSI